MIVLCKVLEQQAESASMPEFPYWLTLILTAGLITILVESTSRVFSLYRKYQNAEANQSGHPQ